MSNIWQVSPGRHEDNYWPEFVEKEIIAMGWDHLGNLNNYNSPEAFREKDPDLGGNDINSLWIFSHEIKENDIIVAKKGSSKELYGIGKVLSKNGKVYDFDTEREYFYHVINVDWKIVFSPDRFLLSKLPKRFVQWTANSLYETRFEIIKNEILEHYPEFQEKFDELNRSMSVIKPKLDNYIFDKIYNLLRKKRQIILYGPPGTGKTWVTKKFVEEYLQKNIPTTKKESLERYSEFITFHQSYSYEEFIEGIRPELIERTEGEPRYKVHPGILKILCNRARQDSQNIYFLIIDEINRGNISKIFGELITLLENDKRLGPGNVKQENTLEAKLPYSKELFTVPWNLLVIGTMNTADKSIALVDVALRRRFGFIEMLPDLSKINPVGIEGIEINLPLILENMNKKISIMFDRDHQIGHSYLMNIDNGKDTMLNLKHAFYNEIFPLVQEYFYNDWEKIQTILGTSFVKEVMSYDAAQNVTINAAQGIYEIIELDGMEFLEALNIIALDGSSSE